VDWGLFKLKVKWRNKIDNPKWLLLYTPNTKEITSNPGLAFVLNSLPWMLTLQT